MVPAPSRFCDANDLWPAEAAALNRFCYVNDLWSVAEAAPKRFAMPSSYGWVSTKLHRDSRKCPEAHSTRARRPVASLARVVEHHVCR